MEKLIKFVDSFLAHFIFWSVTMIVLIGLPIISIAFWGSSYKEIFGIEGTYGQALFIAWLGYMALFVYKSYQPDAKSGFRKIGLNECGVILFFGLPLMVIFIPLPVPLLTGIFEIEKIPFSIQERKDTQGVMTASLKSAADQEDAQKYAGETLSHQATIPITIGWRFRAGRDKTSIICMLRNTGSFHDAANQYLYFTETARFNECSKRIPQQIINDREIIDNALENKIKELAGELSRDINQYIGLETLEVKLLNPVLSEPINIRLLEVMEAQAEKQKGVIEAERDKAMYILLAEGRSKEIELIEHAEYVARALGLEDLSKRLGIAQAMLAEVLYRGPEFLAALPKDTKFILMPGGQNVITSEIIKIFTAISTIDPKSELGK